ncbi:hypothetical protein JR316_0003943 [Psilocybe cubensis]|uniref:Uncharacterized protein n=2 Tax=Psilocybe cubensis TaxID=181762 RepID=A0A8H8CNF6_PSICU|nr:hypothetical protein JR316_0003943 [Psilocybe cubensis]KAH9484461.1 hypothetical protein JR316_0003943 [Psilocybe cubensis]
MAGEPTRWVVVDDTDGGIDYVGPSWRADVGSFDSAGNFGLPYRRTLHGTNVDASFSYLFNGTGVKLVGFNNPRNNSGVLDPTWECLVDGVNIRVGRSFQYPEHNWLFCDSPQFADGLHNLTVKVSVKAGQTFWFDKIMYSPSPTLSLYQKDIIVDNGDSGFEYGDGWQSFSAISNMTSITNSVMSFNFTGSSFSWYGFIPGDYPTASSSGTYSVDGEEPVQFTLNGLSPGSTTTLYNQKFFETQQYPVGNHMVVVQYLGGPKVTPLVLDYLVINNGTDSPSSSPTSPISPSSNSSGTTSTPSNTQAGPLHPNSTTKTKNSAIVGGVIGGTVLVLFAIVGALWIRKRGRNLLFKKSFEDLPKEYIINPFQYNPDAATTIVQPRRPPPPPVERTRQKTQRFSGPDEDPFSPPGHAGPSPNDSRPMMYQITIDRKRRLARQSEDRIVAQRQSNSATSPSHTINARQSRIEPLRQSSSSFIPSPSHSVSVRSLNSSGSAPLIVHEDSGIRMSVPEIVRAVEIPPIYTVG